MFNRQEIRNYEGWSTTARVGGNLFIVIAPTQEDLVGVVNYLDLEGHTERHFQHVEVSAFRDMPAEDQDRLHSASQLPSYKLVPAQTLPRPSLVIGDAAVS